MSFWDQPGLAFAEQAVIGGMRSEELNAVYYLIATLQVRVFIKI